MWIGPPKKSWGLSIRVWTLRGSLDPALWNKLQSIPKQYIFIGLLIVGVEILIVNTFGVSECVFIEAERTIEQFDSSLFHHNALEFTQVGNSERHKMVT